VLMMVLTLGGQTVILDVADIMAMVGASVGYGLKSYEARKAKSLSCRMTLMGGNGGA